MRAHAKRRKLEDWQQPDLLGDAMLLAAFCSTPFFMASVGGLWVGMRFYDAWTSTVQATTTRKVA